jgi:hypothetical protein
MGGVRSEEDTVLGASGAGFAASPLDKPAPRTRINPQF